MKRYHQYLISLLTVISCTSVAVSFGETIEGNGVLSTHTRCTGYAHYYSSVMITCGSDDDFVHITKLRLDKNCSSTGQGRWSWLAGSSSIDACEGETGRCILEFKDFIDSIYVYDVRQIQVTFQCIRGTRVHSMCPTTTITTTATYGQPVYFTTPGFTDSNYYPNHANCQCTAMPSIGSAVKMQLLYVDLEKNEHACYDYISVGSNKYSGIQKYCQKSTNTVSKTYSTGEYAVIGFHSDLSNHQKGAWYSISTASNKGTVSINCRGTYQTTTIPTTTRRPRTLQYLTVRGTAALKSHTYCSDVYNYRQVKLLCSNYSVIHISHLQLDVNENHNCSGYGDCTRDFTDYMKICEGQQSSCAFYPYQSGSTHCAQVNHIEITFQCVPDTKVHPICPIIRTVTTTNGQPVFFATPQFTESSGQYSDNTNCQCTAVPSSGRAIAITVPFLDLETGGSSGCLDYLSISSSSSSNHQNCQKIGHKDNPIFRVFHANTPVYIKFYTDFSNKLRGTWFSIKTATEGGSITITCTDSDSTVIPPTTTSRTTTPYRTRDTGTIATFQGTGELASYGKCVQFRITEVNLECNSSDDIIHISRLTLAYNYHDDCSTSTECTWSNDNFITACEGKKSPCTFYTSQQYSSYCSSINQINITFQCVPSASIHSLCPSTKTETSITSGLPAYFTTPQFTIEGGQYPSDSNCQCYAVPADNAVVKTSILYAALEVSSHCNDYISFSTNNGGSENKYCQQRATASPTNGSFGVGNTVSFHFVSDTSNSKRGAWFAVYTASDGGSLTITCSDQPFTSPLISGRLSRIIGGGVGGGLSAIVIVSIVLIYCTRRMTRAANQGNQSNRTQSPPSMMLRPGTTPPRTAEPSTISGQASSSTTGNESRGNADELPPSYSELTIPSEQQTATSLI